MQIKGNCFIPPTNLLWLPATGLWGEIQPRRKPESKSLCAKCSLQDGFAAAAAERCSIPWLGYSAWRKRCGGVRLAEESWDGAVSLGTGLGTQGWQCPGGCGKRGRDRASEDKELHPGDGQGRRDPGKGSELQLHRMGSVGEGFSTNSKFIKSKQEKIRVSRDRKNSWLRVKFSKIFLARRGRVRNHHF